MKKASLLILSITAVLFSCGGDDEKPSHNFKNQTLSGKIANTPWAYGDGYAEIYGTGDDSEIYIDMFKDVDGEGCGSIPEGNQVFFYVPNKVGVYKLKFDLNNLEASQTITLFEDEGVMNSIAAEGVIEITAITETTISGRIDAKVDAENNVNGNFTVNICQ